MARRPNLGVVTPVPYPPTQKIKAPRDLQTWAQSAKDADLKTVDWNVEETADYWQALVDAIAKHDREVATAGRDSARVSILKLSEGSIWERVLWPGHEEARGARRVLETAASELPKGVPTSLEWPAAIQRVEGVVVAARDLLQRANVPSDVTAANLILVSLAAAMSAAKHALDAPELVTAQAPPAPRQTPTDTGSGWVWFLIGALVVAAYEESEQ